MQVILGGGRQEFVPRNTFDPEADGGLIAAGRLDDRNLIQVSKLLLLLGLTPQSRKKMRSTTR